MATGNCRNICVKYKAKKTNKAYYSADNKYCTPCETFLPDINKNYRCICCSTLLRSRPRRSRRLYGNDVLSEEMVNRI